MDLGDFFGRAGGDELSALGAGFGSDLDHVVGFGDDAEIVFDDHDGVALVGQAVEDAE